MNPARFGIATGLALSIAAAIVVHPAAQQQAQYPKSSPTIDFKPAAGRCLPPDQMKVNDTYNSLNRPTRPGDEMPFWDPEYFVGNWDVDMRTQDSPLGPGGPAMATLTIKANDKNGCLYEGTMKGDDPDGKPFTRTVSLLYDPAKKVLTWTEKDSRGFTLVRKGVVGGELGGLFHFHFGEDATQPDTTFAGKKIKFKGVLEMSSPAFNRTDIQMSIDGAPYVTYGRMMLEKQLPGGK